MSRARRLLIPNTCYHLITRGNQKQPVFRMETDYQTYLSLLGRFKKRYSFAIYAYCLMPNHIHILGEPKIPPFLPKFMLAMNRTYTEYFNKKYGKVGHLWQGRFKSKVIHKDRYLLDCFKYIETNPVRAGLTKSPISYRWSSCVARTLDAYDPILDTPDIS